MESAWTDPWFWRALGSLAVGLTVVAMLAYLLHEIGEAVDRRESAARREARVSLERFLAMLHLVRQYLAERRRV